ncbi:hypothetical protein JCM30471_28480 [Desulfuromonas carbonis]
MSHPPKQQLETPVKGDLRKDLRAPLIIYRLRFDDGRRTFFGYSKNISRSGLFIATVNPRETGQRFEVEIPLPAPIGRTVRCTCEVVWKRQFDRRSLLEPGMGLRFIDLPDDVAQAIDFWAGAQET